MKNKSRDKKKKKFVTITIGWVISWEGAGKWSTRGIRGHKASMFTRMWTLRSSKSLFLSPSSHHVILGMMNFAMIMKNAPFASWFVHFINFSLTVFVNWFFGLSPWAWMCLVSWKKKIKIIDSFEKIKSSWLPFSMIEQSDNQLKVLPFLMRHGVNFLR